MQTRSFLLCVLAFSLARISTRADIIAQWNFNGSAEPSYGNGTAELIGGVTATFATGCTNDPAATGNTGWNTTHYPAQATGNKTAGLQFSVSTAGYTDITVCWDQKASSTASKYCRLQYSTDGVNFFDTPEPVFTREISSSSSYYEPHARSLLAIPEVSDNANLAFRIVSEFESTAAGAGLNEYVTTYGTNSYRTSGTLRFDMVTLLGTPLPGANTAPRISTVPDQTLLVEQATGPLDVTVSDAEDAPESLALSASSSDLSVVPLENIELGGTAGSRTVSVKACSVIGSARITLVVADTGGRSNVTSFVVTVLPANSPPYASSVSGTNLIAGPESAAVLAFTIGDAETPAEFLEVSVRSGNPRLVPNDSAHLGVGGFGSNRTVRLAPAQGQAGVAPILLEVSDGTNITRNLFPLMVAPSASIILYEEFSYPDGAVVTNSAFLWDTRSGTAGQCQVLGGELQITASQTEDVAARLVGGPYSSGRGVILYASLKIKFLGIPKPTPDYFAHLVAGSALRGRIYAQATDVWPGSFRLGVANGSSTNTLHAAVLSTNTTYILITRYDVDAATTTLWINPDSESAPAAIAADLQAPVAITGYGVRQATGLGTTVSLDKLKVGFTFAAVTTDVPQGAIALEISRLGNTVLLRWSDPTWFLQAGAALTGPFTNLPGAASPFEQNASETARYYRLALTPSKSAACPSPGRWLP